VTAPSDPATRTADRDVASPAPPPPHRPLEPRQRWRIAFAREQPAGDEVPTGREYIGRWEGALVAAGLPTVTVATGRPRIALGAPLPAGCSAEGELLEFWLTDVRPAWVVREGLQPVLPAGHRLVGLENVWLGAPALSGQIAAADYEAAVRGGASDGQLAAAAVRLLAADRLPRQRIKGGETKTYDLRPLVVTLEVSASTLRMRTRIHPELGTGRPEEVVATLADIVGAPLDVGRIVRRRLILADELAT
jgi:radical SAM-linked protein